MWWLVNYIYTQIHTHVYIPLFRITIKTQRLFQYEHLKWSNITVCDKSWLFWVIFGWLWMVVDSCGWIFWVVVDGCGWLRVVMDGCGWLWIFVGGCRWLWVVAYFSLPIFQQFYKFDIYNKTIIMSWLFFKCHVSPTWLVNCESKDINLCPSSMSELLLSRI